MRQLDLAIKVNAKDNVATIFARELVAGDLLEIRDPVGAAEEIKINDPIPYGHKVAVSPIKKGESIIKYGEEIGLASKDISIGDHVHVHNLDSNRGRGDLIKEEVENHAK